MPLLLVTPSPPVAGLTLRAEGVAALLATCPARGLAVSKRLRLAWSSVGRGVANQSAAWRGASEGAGEDPNRSISFVRAMLRLLRLSKASIAGLHVLLQSVFYSS